MSRINFDKHIYEGWTVEDFINELKDIYPITYEMGKEVSLLTSKEEVKKWCMDNQPHYKKHIPDVVKFFINKYKIR